MFFNFKKALIFNLLSFCVISSKAFISPPALSTPANNATIKYFEAYLAASSTSSPPYYQFQYDTVSTFNSAELRMETTNGSSAYTKTLQKGKSYYWRARAFNTGDTSAWSGYRKFTVFNKMELDKPANGATGGINYFACNTWGAYPITKYLFEADTAVSMKTSKRIIRQPGSIYFHDSGLFTYGRRIYWRATAISGLGDTLLWSDIRYYNIFSAPTLNSTADPAPPETTVGWSGTGFGEVVLQIDLNPAFNSSALVQKTLPANRLNDTLRNLLFGKKYYYRIQARFNNQGSNWTSAKNFTVINTLNSPFPANKSTINGLTVAFSWNLLKGTKTQIQIANDTLFKDLITNGFLSTQSYLLPDTLTIGKRYFWRIRALHAKDTSAWQTLYFNIFDGQVMQVLPANAEPNQDIKVRLQFYPFSWANSYFMEIDTGKMFTQIPSTYRVTKRFFNTNTGGNKYFDTLFKYGSNYVWRVYAIRGRDTSTFATERYFTTKSRPLLSFPVNNYIGIGTQTNGLIDPITGSEKVQWEMDTTVTFNSPHYTTGIDTHVLDKFFTKNVNLNFPGDLRFETKYFWRARCLSINDTSDWSLYFNFVSTQRPKNSSPTNKTTNVLLSTKLKWGVQGSASQLIYQYQISTDSNFTGAMITTILKGQPSEASVTCAYGTKYFWRGRAYHSKDTSLWSLATDFTTIPAPTVAKIILYSPQNGISNIPLAPLDLIWFKTTNATSFDVQVASDPDFIAVLTSGNVLGNGVSFSGMNAGKTYYWRVRGKIDDISITGPWSDIWKFSTITSSGIHILDQADLFVYPNPASQQVSIEYQGKFGFQLLNSLGQMVMEKNDLTERTIINTEMLAKGYYQVVVKADNGIVHRKLLIE